MNYSPILIVLVSVEYFQFVYGIGENMKEEMNSIVVKCKESLNLSHETVKGALSKSRVETQDEKCLAGCILEHVGLIKGNSYDWEFHTKIMNVPLYKDFINECKGKVNEDRCALADEIISCLEDEEEKFKENTEPW